MAERGLSIHSGGKERERVRTRGEALLELLRLLGVVEGERVEVACAPDLELGLELATGYPRRDLLYACLCRYSRRC